MKPIVFSLYTPSSFIEIFKNSSEFDLGTLFMRSFPDQESYIKYDCSLVNRDLIIIATLDKPDVKFLSLIFALKTARDLGAKRIGLVLPYLPYMRQDTVFTPGEAVTSKYFAALLSDNIDWLLTIDPHLHRYHSLNEIYSIPSYVLHTTHLISGYIQKNITHPIIIGPDKESEQWVATIAKTIKSPYQISEKIRTSDTEVQIHFSELTRYQNYTPVIVDDIISTGNTMIETIKYMQSIKMKAPVCIGVHALFVKEAYTSILAAGAQSIITCNTIEHISNTIDVYQAIKSTITKLSYEQ